jgi:hypothetical protein
MTALEAREMRRRLTQGLLLFLLFDLTGAHDKNATARFLQDGTEYVRIVVGFNPQHDVQSWLRTGSFDWRNDSNSTTTTTTRPMTAAESLDQTPSSFGDYFAGQHMYAFKRSSAIAITVPVSEIDSILSMPEVEFVEEDAMIHGFQVDYTQTERIPWGISVVQGMDDSDVPMPAEWRNASTENCFAVCVVDAGIRPHPDLVRRMGREELIFCNSFRL